MSPSTVTLALSALAISLPFLPLTASSPVAPSASIKCPIVFDGRIPSAARLTDFDSAATSSFDPDYVKGGGLLWSQILKFPCGVPNARFDNESFKPVEVTISDASIFMKQYGFRRAGLHFKNDQNNEVGTGVKTIHFSVRQDAARPFNLSHEYLNVWHETGDYSATQFSFLTGTLIDQPNLPKNTYKVLGRTNNEIWSTPIVADAWQNFAVTLDYSQDTLQVYYSEGDEPLKSVSDVRKNNNTGAGQYQIGILKKPTGTSDVVNQGYQESNLNEGLFYASLFVEDSAQGCISL